MGNEKQSRLSAENGLDKHKSEFFFTFEEAAQFEYCLLSLKADETRQLADCIETGKATETLAIFGLPEIAAKFKGSKEVAAMIRELAEKKERGEERARLGVNFVRRLPKKQETGEDGEDKTEKMGECEKNQSERKGKNRKKM